MKKLKYIICVILFSFISPALIFSQALDVKTLNYIDSLANSNFPSNGPGMSLLIAKNGIPLYKKAYGMADLELNVPMSPDNVFAIGSMSKQITAVGILQLADQGRLDLNDDIKKYLPDYNSHGSIITIENCLTHTSGIPSFTEKRNFDSVYQKRLSQAEVIDFFQNDELLFEPGSDFSYSNSAYFLLAVIIEKISGMSYNDYVQKHIFDKAGMKNSYFESLQNIIPMRASGYDGRDSTSYLNTSYYERAWAVGAGSIMSTTKDLLYWDEALYSDKLAPQTLLQKAFTPYKLKNGISANYGYGWNVTTLDKYTIIKHGGAINGYLSDGVRVPEEKLYITALTNCTGKSPDEITTKILMKILNISNDQPVEISPDKESLNQYTGAYEVTRQGARLLKNMTDEKQYRYIFVEEDKLMLQRTGGSKIQLKSYQKDKFFSDGSDRRFEFVRDAGGNIVALETYSYPVNFGPNDLCPKADVEMPGEKSEALVSPDILKKYEGEYELQPGLNLKMFVENNALFIQATGQEKFQLYPESESKFFMKVVDAQAEFVSDPDGSVNKLIFTQGQKFECKRIK